MRNLLLASVAVIALTGCNDGNASSPPSCTATNTLAALQPILQKNIVDVYNLAVTSNPYVTSDPNDPYVLNMKESPIITLDETPHKTNCKISPSITKKSDQDKTLKGQDLGDDDWITYSVEVTDNSDAIFVSAHWSASLNQSLENMKAGIEMLRIAKQMQAENAAREAKEKAANTIDTTASCDSLKAGINNQTAISNYPQLSLAATDVSTISPGVCLVYMVRSRSTVVDLPPYHSVYVYGFSQVTYNMTFGGEKIAKEDEWLPNPLDGQSVPAGMQHNSNIGYFSDQNLLEAGTKAPPAELSPLEKVRHGLRDDGTPASTAGGAPRPPIQPKPRIQTNDPAGMY